MTIRSTTRPPTPLLAGTAIVLMFGVALARGVTPFAEPDLWWHLRVGEHILATGEINGTDPWARFATHPYTATQWLAEVAAAACYRWFGMGAIVWLRSLAIIAMTLLVYAASRRFAGRLPSALAASVAILASGASLNPRPQLVSFVLFAAAVYAWLGTARDLRPRWWLVPMFWIWACCHGLWGFGLLLGVLTTTALLVDRRVVITRSAALRLGGLNLASCAAVACTPLGPGLLVTPFRVANNASWIADEWQATPVSNPYSITAVAAILITATLWMRKARPRPLWQMAFLGLAAALTLWMWRLVPLGSILAAPILASALNEGLLSRPERASRSERLGLGFGTLAAALVATLVSIASGSHASQFPQAIGSIDKSLDRVPEKSVIFADFGISGWLLWTHPQLVPVADLRMELYGEKHLRDYIAASQARPGWETFVASTTAEYALEANDSPLADALIHRKGWSVVAKSKDFTLLKAPGAGE